MLKLRSKSMETPKAKAILAERLKNANWVDLHSNFYFLRVENNHFVLLEVCEALKAAGVECFTARDEYERERTHYINGYKDGKRVQFGFSEVPYRWWINNSSYEHGNCRDIKGQHGFDYPYEISDILNNLRPCTAKELEDYERKKTSEFYIRL